LRALLSSIEGIYFKVSTVLSELTEGSVFANDFRLDFPEICDQKQWHFVIMSNDLTPNIEQLAQT